MTRGLPGVMLLVLVGACASTPGGEEVSVVLQGAGPEGGELQYLAHIPEAPASDEKWPLLVILHGRGEIGGSLSRVKIHGPLKPASAVGNFGLLMVAPHLPANVNWDPEWVMATIEDARRRWPVDPSRIYLTGLSLGGHGTWETAVEYPAVFAAIAPISAWGNPGKACALADMPIRSFHGVRDRIVSSAQSQVMVDAVRNRGGAPALTLYRHLGHDAWTETYNSSRFYAWLLSHTRLEDNEKGKSP